MCENGGVGFRCAADCRGPAAETRGRLDTKYPYSPGTDPVSRATANTLDELPGVRFVFSDGPQALPPQPRRSFSEIAADVPNQPVRVEREVGECATLYRVSVPNHVKFAPFAGERGALRMARVAGAEGYLTYFGKGEVREDPGRPTYEPGSPPAAKEYAPGGVQHVRGATYLRAPEAHLRTGDTCEYQDPITEIAWVDPTGDWVKESGVRVRSVDLALGEPEFDPAGDDEAASIRARAFAARQCMAAALRAPDTSAKLHHYADGDEGPGVDDVLEHAASSDNHVVAAVEKVRADFDSKAYIESAEFGYAVADELLARERDATVASGAAAYGNRQSSDQIDLEAARANDPKLVALAAWSGQD